MSGIPTIVASRLASGGYPVTIGDVARFLFRGVGDYFVFVFPSGNDSTAHMLHNMWHLHIRYTRKDYQRFNSKVNDLIVVKV